MENQTQKQEINPESNFELLENERNPNENTINSHPIVEGLNNIFGNELLLTQENSEIDQGPINTINEIPGSTQTNVVVNDNPIVSGDDERFNVKYENNKNFIEKEKYFSKNKDNTPSFNLSRSMLGNNRNNIHIIPWHNQTINQSDCPWKFELEFRDTIRLNNHKILKIYKAPFEPYPNLVEINIGNNMNMSNYFSDYYSRFKFVCSYYKMIRWYDSKGIKY